MRDVIFVAGAIANKYGSGGEAWVRMSWARGLQQLGFDVFFVEQINASACSDAQRGYFRDVIARFGLADRAALIGDDETTSQGVAWNTLCDAAEAARLLVNISGHLTNPALFRRFRRTAYVDIDPGFTQFWHDDPAIAFRVPQHSSYFTIGANIGQADCAIPMCGIEWKHVRQPVVLDDWPVRSSAACDRLTTIANWRGPFGAIEFGGKKYGIKVHEFRKFVEVPRRVGQSSATSPQFELALNIDPTDSGDLAALRDNGWIVTDPQAASFDADAFQRYVQQSAAEFSVAQGVYVDTNSGWFSDRTVRYLASGKPAVVQETGFSRELPVGRGLMSFRTVDHAVARVGDVVSNYVEHCTAAREVAETHFDSNKVLSRFVDEAGVR
jgi:hypothetical protein